MKETKNTLKAIDFQVEGRGGNAFLLTGDDAYWHDYVTQKLLSLLSETEREFNYRSFSDIKSIDEAESAFSSMGFWGGLNIVSISGYGAKKSASKGESKASEREKQNFEDILSNLGESTILIVTDSNIPLTLKKYFIEVDCGKLDAITLRNYIPKLIAPKKIDGNALYTLIEYCNRDMAHINNEIQKLKAYMGTKQVITLEMVDGLVANTVENEIYELANAIAEKNKLKAASLFDKFVSKGIDFSFILSSLVSQYRRLLHCALSKKSDKELSETLKIKEFAVKKSRETASKYGKAVLKSCLDDLVDAEFNFKSGVMVDETAVRTVMAKLMAK